MSECGNRALQVKLFNECKMKIMKYTIAFLSVFYLASCANDNEQTHKQTKKVVCDSITEHGIDIDGYEVVNKVSQCDSVPISE